MKKGNLFVIWISLACLSSASAAESTPGISSELLDRLNSWLDENTEFEGLNNQPRIELIDAEQAHKLSGVSNHSNGNLRGQYDAATQTIYLTKPWVPTKPRDVSVLLHELVHHRQTGRHWYCPQAQEWRAYQIQAQWLHEQNIGDNSAGLPSQWIPVAQSGISIPTEPDGPAEY